MSSAQETNDLVAGEVRAWLGRRQISGRMVAQRLGWTEVYLNRRVRAEVPFNVADLALIAELLEVPVTAFFESPRGVNSSVSRLPARLAAAA